MFDGSGKVVSHFSCGAASAVATKLAVEKYGRDSVTALNAFCADEHIDNRRFLADCESWFDAPVTVVRDTKYGASALEVMRRKRFIVNRNGAPCSKVLKRDVLNAVRKPDDLLVLGFTADARDAERLNRFIDANPDQNVWAPLIDAGITKRDCFRILASAKIKLPITYYWGLPNGNCLNCPKGGMGYWNLLRRVAPDNFEAMAVIQDDLGPGSYFFRDRKNGDRISLRMLDPNAGRLEPVASFECGAICEWPQAQLDFGPQEAA